jgi:hypothetical protein
MTSNEMSAIGLVLLAALVLWSIWDIDNDDWGGWA